ncbi:MAG: COG4705 family protein [Rhodomicrobiaceae bacterium]
MPQNTKNTADISTVATFLEETIVNRVAQITLAFWIMKILATTLGETAGDFISMTLNLGYYVGFGITFFILAIILYAKVSAATYSTSLFWIAIVATTTAGTEISDMMDRSFGLGYLWGSLILVTGLIISLSIWLARHKNLTVYPIYKREVEVIFWIAVIFSNSLGTAFGDFLTDNMGLSYIEGAMVTAAVIGSVIALHYATKINEVFLFWIAFIFTRPFGATFGDFLTKPLENGGLNMPREYASGITLVLLVTVLAFSLRQRKVLKTIE